MKRIFTVQHTQSEHHTNGMVGSWTDWSLTELGKQQADRIAIKLKQELDGKKIVLYTSDLKRAKQTADSIASQLKVVPIVKTELRERNLGRCCGKSVQWLRENLECDEKTIDDRLFPDAESRRDEWNRLKPFFDQIMAAEAENIIIVSHGDLLSVFNSMFLGLGVASLNTCELFGFAGGVSQMIVRDDGKRIIKRIGDMSFVL
ncbi:MAG: phosphoglycerate mutase family protein [bacterium]|nr:phosphoglycerate mutase family protein [bacterium]